MCYRVLAKGAMPTLYFEKASFCSSVVAKLSHPSLSSIHPTDGCDRMKLDRENTPLLILCVLQLADIVSTRLALKVPGVLELNPLVRQLGLWQSKLAVLGVIVLLALWVKRTKRVAAVWLVCGVYVLIVASNFRLVIAHAGF